MEGEGRKVQIDEIEANFENILAQVGQASFVHWEDFTKSSKTLTSQIQELGKRLSIFSDIQQRRFMGTMRKLKSCDVPDLIKTVRAKKLPKETLRTIIPKFRFEGEKLVLTETPENLKGEALKVFNDYTSTNDEIANKLKEATQLLQAKINDSGLYQPPSEPKELVSTFKHEFDEGKLEAVKSTIQIEYLPGTVDTLHIKTYAQIVEATLEVVKSEYKRLTHDSREKQRKSFGSRKEYLDCLLEYLTNTEVLIVDGQKAVVKQVGLTQEKFEESENGLMKKGLAENLLMIQSALRSKVKQSMPAEKETSLEHAKEILKYQVKELKERVDFFKEMFEKLERTPENYQMIPMLLALTLNDMVYQKFNLEEEDFMKNVGDNVILTNPEIMKIFKEMEEAIIKLMQELGIINPEAAAMMQEQAKQGLQGMPNQMGNTPGLSPGANPMDMLQMAQFEQMQKMMAQQQQAPKK